MTTPAELGLDPVFDITHDVFSALVDQGETTLTRSERPFSGAADLVYAWVDMAGAVSGRAVVRSADTTARDLARALLGMDPGTEVSEADLVDAFGEVANVVGGNLKSLIADAGQLALPRVSVQPPPADDATLVSDLVLEWRGQQLAVSVWHLAP